ncbi:hypothetical protein quinque_000780 [Culex quinquefasciatus]
MRCKTIYHKINYVAPGSTLKVATYAAAAPAHYEYAAAVPGLTKVMKLRCCVGTIDVPAGMYQYAAAAAYPQYQYAAYPQQHQIQHQQHQQQQQPQYQVYQHHQTVQLPAASAIISTAPHPHQTVATLPAHQIQPGTTIYAAHQPAAFHYTLTQPAQHQQQHNYQQQQSAGHSGTFTYHQAVPVVHQAPIAAIGQVHHHQQQQQQQVVANQYPVVPTAAAPLYATASTSPNQFYHQPTNYGDPDTLTNFNTSPLPTGSGFKPYNRKTHVKPVIEYDYDRDRFTSGEEPCEDDIYVYNPSSVDKKKKNGTSSFDRNLQTLIRTYGVATALLRASNQAGDKQKKKKKPQQNGANGDNTDRIQLIHPPSDGDKKLKAGKGGISNGRKYYHYHYDHDHDDYHHGGDGYGYGRRGYDKHSYRRTLDPAYPVPLAAKQIVSTVPAPTLATPTHHQHHLKQLIPVTTATTTHHHGKGISYATFTQQANPASLGHLQQHYLQQQQHQQQQQQQQHQPRYQVYSTVATPQKQTLVYGPAGQSSIPAAIYATAPTHLQLAAFQQHQQQQQQQQSVHYGTHLFQQQLAQYQQQPAYVAPLAKINYGQVQAQAVALQKGGGYYHQVQ